MEAPRICAAAVLASAPKANTPDLCAAGMAAELEELSPKVKLLSTFSLSCPAAEPNFTTSIPPSSPSQKEYIGRSLTGKALCSSGKALCSSPPNAYDGSSESIFADGLNVVAAAATGLGSPKVNVGSASSSASGSIVTGCAACVSGVPVANSGGALFCSGARSLKGL